jgi:hypothetical protein
MEWEVSGMAEGWDDEQLLDALRAAMRARQAVPPKFIDTARNVFTWHDVDAELAQLTYDSSRDHHEAVAVRSETASVRSLTFASARFQIELEVSRDRLLGQILPPQAGTVEAESQSGAVIAAEIDEVGTFSVDPVPASPFRLRCHAADGMDVVTGWITL